MKSGNIVIWDLDSTLIDTNAVFENAQKQVISKLSNELSKLSIDIDPNSEKEIDELRTVDYEGIKLRGHTAYDSPHQLPLSLLYIYLKKGNLKEEYAAAWIANKGMELAEEVGKEYLEKLNETPKKFTGIEKVLEESAKRNYNILLTEYFGNEEKQYKKINENQLNIYFDKIIASEKKDSIAIMSATEYGKLENGIKDKEFKLVFVDDRSKYLEMAKAAYPFCITVNVLFGKKEIFRESSNNVDYTAKNVSELSDILKKI
ncbi:MAG: HAD hydrolase-like protein [Candidatus Parvarchaeum sp.]|nr:HAD hydrolase-like protein [Candidatus Parvarchaeota archaeon]MCW1296000.1 HAD hydrolase-like protein [Candidatus Parvarchaeum tengchongense]MCW1298904.1 HAD hydrolase-like protein [Candidatus Parvarchaeum tengchongense]